MRELERQLGVRLFDRRTRRVQLTDAGYDLQPFVQRVLNDLGDAIASVSSLRDKKRGLLRIAAPQLMACTLMPRVIVAYGNAFPDIKVEMTDTLPEQMLAGVLSGEVDLVIGPDGHAEVELVRRTLLRDRHRLICASTHPLTRKRTVRWKDFQGRPFIAPTRDFMRRLQPELSIHAPGFALKPAYGVSYMTTALGMVAAGLGITACPSFSAPLVKAYGLEMRLLVEPGFYREVCIYRAPHKSMSPAAESFVEFLQNFVAHDGIEPSQRLPIMVLSEANGWARYDIASEVHRCMPPGARPLSNTKKALVRRPAPNAMPR